MSIQGSINQALGSLGQTAAVASGLKKMDRSIKQTSPEAQLEAAKRAREQERQENITRTKENIYRSQMAYFMNKPPINESYANTEGLKAQRVMAAQNWADEAQNLYKLDPTTANLKAAIQARGIMMGTQDDYEKFTYDHQKAVEAIQHARQQQQTKAELKKQTKSFIETNWNSWGQTNDPDPNRKLEV